MFLGAFRSKSSGEYLKKVGMLKFHGGKRNSTIITIKKSTQKDFSIFFVMVF
jgi:hypothetical protein